MEKQIEEIGRYMAKVAHSECALKRCEDCKWCGEGDRKADCTDYLIAEHLYNAGYRKQSEGHWVTRAASYECSECGEEVEVDNPEDYNPVSDYDLRFCSSCGAKMKGANNEKND